MSSFVDLMANDVWSEEDICARMRAMRRQQYSDEEWEFICQKMIGALIGLVPEFSALAYPLSDAEKGEIAAFAALLRSIQEAGRAARADMALLAQAMTVEAAQAALAADPTDAAAQAVIDAAAPDVLALVALRNPPPEVQP